MNSTASEKKKKKEKKITADCKQGSVKSEVWRVLALLAGLNEK